LIQHRDVLSISITEEDELIFASDCSGGIGRKSADMVQVDPEIVGYYSFRVAVMECLAVGANLLAVQLFNFTDDTVWEKYCQGVRTGLSELDIDDIPLTGSSESNITLKQSAIGITCIGRRKKKRKKVSRENHLYALIGTPLSGDEVLEHGLSVAPLSLFNKCIHHPSIIDILPVGSKGVRHELSLLTGKLLGTGDVDSFHDLDKSSGPATSFIITYKAEEETAIKKLTEGFYQSIHFI
jgi:hypothetical protein